MSVPIVPTFQLGSLDLTAAPYAVEFGADLGTPENVYETVLSFLRDGEAVSSTRTSNRDLVLTVVVEGGPAGTPSTTHPLTALAKSEDLLLAEADKPRNTLTITPDLRDRPGMGDVAPTVFDTFRAQVTLLRNDDEEQAAVRRYRLTIPALPYPRSDRRVAGGGLRVDQTPFVLPKSSTSNPWTLRPNGETVTLKAVYKSAADASANSPLYTALATASEPGVTGQGIVFKSTGPAGMPNGSYLGVSIEGLPYLWKPTQRFIVCRQDRSEAAVNIELEYQTEIGGNSVYQTMRKAIWTGGEHPTNSAFTMSYFPVPKDCARIVRVTFYSSTAVNAGAAWTFAGMWGADALPVYAGNVNGTGMSGLAPTAHTASEVFQTLTRTDVQGAVTSEAAINVVKNQPDIGFGLGEVCLYTMPLSSAYSPAMNKFATTTDLQRIADPTSSSGRSWTVTGGSAVTYDIPVSALPEGNVQMWTHVKSSTASFDIDWTVQAMSRDAVAMGPQLSGRSTANASRLNQPTLAPLAALSLPLFDVGQYGFLRVTVGMVGVATAWMSLYELLMFDVGVGDLTVFDTSDLSGSPVSQYAWVEPPSLDKPLGGVWHSAGKTRIDATSAEPIAWATHRLYTEGTAIYCLSARVGDVSASVDYYPRWHTSADVII